jgi:hypothetical protein
MLLNIGTVRTLQNDTKIIITIIIICDSHTHQSKEVLLTLLNKVRSDMLNCSAFDIEIEWGGKSVESCPHFFTASSIIFSLNSLIFMNGKWNDKAKEKGATTTLNKISSNFMMRNNNSLESFTVGRN